MINELIFYKATLYGNKFVIISEIENEILFDEPKIKKLAEVATSEHLGIGADNLIVIQKSNTKTWDEIKFKYHSDNYDFDRDLYTYIFRMYEPDGQEALSCINGLLCVAKYFDQQNIKFPITIATEIPTLLPKKISLYKNRNDTFTVDISQISYNYQDFVNTKYVNSINTNNIVPSFVLSLSSQINLNFDFVFTGEPHIIAFVKNNEENIEHFFLETKDIKEICSEGLCSFHNLGITLNHNTKLFPKGINLNIAIVKDRETIIYRSFERGILKETLACGTGALAISIAAFKKGYVDKNIRLSSVRNSYLNNKKYINVNLSNPHDLLVSGIPKIIFRGYIEI